MIKIGMIGMSSGNAHPYSWTAIINGAYDAAEIIKAGFPAVSDYLKANEATLGVIGARITHIWCEERTQSESIARSGHIEFVLDQLTDLIGQVDAVILARDDPDRHWEMAQPFLEAGVPIFVDKPLTVDLDELDQYKACVDQGKFLMSCSSMRYANEIMAAKASLSKLGPIHLLTVVGKKDWKKYGVHMVEAVLSLLDDPRPIAVQYLGKPDYDIVQLEISPNCYASIHLIDAIVPTFQLSVFGEQEWTIVDIRNSYAMFKENILEFIKSIQLGKPTLDFSKTVNVIEVVAKALQSKQMNNQKIYF